MSVIELKAGLIAQISEVEDETVLLQIKALLEEAIDREDRMTPSRKRKCGRLSRRAKTRRT